MNNNFTMIKITHKNIKEIIRNLTKYNYTFKTIK